MIFRNHVIVTLEWGLGSINSLGLNKKISEIQGKKRETTVGAEENGGGGNTEEEDGVSWVDVVIHCPADGVGAFFREVDCDSGFAAGSGGGSWGGPRLQPAFLAQSSSNRSLGHEIKLLRRVFAISSWSSCSAPSSCRCPNHGHAHLATVVPPPTHPSSRNPHSPSDNAAVTSARVVAASSEAPESLPLTVAAIFGLKSSGTPQWLIFNYLHS
ncbi:hypothetical protein Bca4012_005725 [Brassica carinata]